MDNKELWQEYDGEEASDEILRDIVVKLQYDSFANLWNKGDPNSIPPTATMSSGLSSDDDDVRKTLFWSSGVDAVMIPLARANGAKIMDHYVGYYNGLHYS